MSTSQSSIHVQASAKDRKICMGLSAAKEIQVKATQKDKDQDGDQQLVIAIIVSEQQNDEDKEYNIILLQVF